MVIAALGIIIEIWKQPNFPLNDEWISKLLCTYTAEYYSALKKEILTDDVT